MIRIVYVKFLTLPVETMLGLLHCDRICMLFYCYVTHVLLLITCLAFNFPSIDMIYIYLSTFICISMLFWCSQAYF